MRTKRSLGTSTQLQQKLKWEYKAAAFAVFTIVVGVGVFIFLNFGKTETTMAEIAAEETGITSYEFTHSQSGSLENMGSGTTTLIGSNRSNAASDVAQIGFNFVFMGKIYNSFSVNANGVLRFGDDPIVPDANTFGIPGNDRIAVLAVISATERLSIFGITIGWINTDATIKTKENGVVHAKVFGTAPNRILVVEWKNMGLPPANAPTVTFQLKLHESDPQSTSKSGTIEMVYGKMSFGNNYRANFRTGFGVGPEAGNFYSINTSNNSLSETATSENEDISDLDSNNNTSRKTFKFVSSRRPSGSFSNFSLTCPAPNSVSIKFSENSADEAGLAVYRKKLGESDSKFSLVRSLLPDLRIFSDGGIKVGERYVYRFYFLGEGLLSIDYTDYVTDPIPTSSAYQTVLSGNWTNQNTWGGVVPEDYKDVVIGCSGTVFITANAHVRVKNLTIEAGSFFTIADGQTVEVAGDFINNGVFNPIGTGKLVFSGGEDQIIENNGLGKTNDTKFTSGTRNTTWDASTTGNVANKSINVTDNNFIAIKEVVVDIQHTYLRDLTLYLVAPDGTRFKLAENRGQRGVNYSNVSFTPLGQPLPPSVQNVNLSGSYRPEESFSTYGGSLKGNWTLSVYDLMPGVGGTLSKFELVLTKGGSNDLVVRNMNVNKSGGGITLNSGLFIEGDLNLQGGFIYTSDDNPITFENGATSSAGNLNSFISGPVFKRGNQDFTFPLGKAGKWAPIAISGMRSGNSTTTFRAEYFAHGKDGDNTLETSDLQIVTNREYWDLAPLANGPRVDITLHWKNNSGEFINPNTAENLVVAHYTGGKWKNEKGIASSTDFGIGGHGSIKVTSIRDFSPFTFGSTAIEGILPVELVSFTGVNKGKENLLTWITASENNNSHFEVEKSLDGKLFEEIGRVQGNGDAHHTISYTYTDRLLTAPQAYYRLKQVDFNGDFEYSKIIVISGGILEKPETKLYPNPANKNDQFVVIDLTGLNVKQADVIVRNSNGQPVFQARLDEAFGLAKEQLDISSLKLGIYIVEINTVHGKEVKRLIVR